MSFKNTKLFFKAADTNINREIGIMSDKIILNPFTGTALSASDILQLDANQDGIVSSEELYSNAEFIAKYTSEDSEGDVQIEEGDYDNLKDAASGIFSIMKSPFIALGGTIKGGFEGLVGVGGYIGNTCKGLGIGIWNMAKGTVSGVGNLLNGVFGGVKSFGSGLVNGWKQIFNGNIGQGLVTFAKGIGNAIWQPIKGVGKAVAAVGKGIAKGAKAIGEGIVDGAKALGKGVAKAAKAVGKGIANAAKAIGKGLKKIFSGW